MAIIRKYETKEECVDCFISERFDLLDSTLITELYGWRDRWDFVSCYDEEIDGPREDVSWYDEDDELMYYESDYTVNGAPAWNTWFEPNDSWIKRWCSDNIKKLTECGFVVILHDGEFWGLGVDGAGYSFRDTHFTRLYDAMDLHWHD